MLFALAGFSDVVIDPKPPWERRRPGGSKINPTTAFRLKRKVPNRAKTKLAAIATPVPARRRRSQDVLIGLPGPKQLEHYFPDDHIQKYAALEETPAVPGRLRDAPHEFPAGRALQGV